MSAGTVPEGVVVVQPDTGKTIDQFGVVITRNINMLSPTQPAPGKGAVGITSHRFVEYGDTTGPITQMKIDDWVPGEVGTRGSFDTHHHGGDQPMGEYFIVLRGAAGFRYRAPGGPEQEVVLGQEAAIYFPPGVEHAGWCEGLVSARVMVIGVREVVHPCDEGKKGSNIPSAS